MFRDKLSGKIHWGNIFLTKLGVLFALYTMHIGAHNHVWVKNVENTIMHGPRKTAAGFYEGDAEVRVHYNKDGHKERYFVYLPSEKRYALGRDGLAKSPQLLLDGLENRVKGMNAGQAAEISDDIEELRKRVYEKASYQQPENNQNKERKKRDWWPLW